MTAEEQIDLSKVDAAHYPYRRRFPTRFSDNDMLNHLNNVMYYEFIQSVVVQFQMEVGQVDWARDEVAPVVVESRCRFLKPISFPETVTAGLKVVRIGRSSVTFAIGLYGDDLTTPTALADFVHVFAHLKTETPQAIPEAACGRYREYTVP